MGNGGICADESISGGVPEDRLAGAGALAGKTVIHAASPIANALSIDSVLRFFTSLDETLMERLHSALPDARLVKKFNSVGNAQLVNPGFAGGNPTMFI